MTIINKMPLYMGVFLSLASAHAMELCIPKTTFESAQKVLSRSRVPSLKKLILTQLVHKVAKEHDIPLLNFLKAGYHEESARILADDNRILLWDIFRNTQKPLILDHSKCDTNELTDPTTCNNVAAAAYSPDGKHLVTIISAGEGKKIWIVTVWSASTIKKHYKTLNLPLCTTAPKSFQENTLPPLMPHSKCALEAELPSYGCTATFNVQGTRLFITDSLNIHCLKFDAEGILSTLWRISTKQNEEKNGETPKGAENAPDMRYLGGLSLNSQGDKALIQVATDSYSRRDLYCIDIANEDVLAPFPYQNQLDSTRMIACDITSASWYPDGNTVLVLEHETPNKTVAVVNHETQRNDAEDSGSDHSSSDEASYSTWGKIARPKAFRTINAEGILLQKFDRFPDYIGTDPIWIQVTPDSRFSLVKSINDDSGWQNIRDRVDLYDIKTCTIKAILDDRSTEERSIGDAIIMPDERYVLIMLGAEDNDSYWIAIWDTITGTGTAAIIIDKADLDDIGSINFKIKVSPKGNYLLVTATNDNQNYCKSRIFSLQTPFAAVLSLDELILLIRMKNLGKDAVLANHASKQLFENIGSSSSHSAAVLKAVQSYFENNV